MAKEQRQSGTRSLARSLLVPSVVLVSAVLLWWHLTSRQAPVPKVPQPPVLPVQQGPIEQGPSLEQWFNSTAVPLLKQTQQKNLEAADRCIGRIDAAFARYQRGVGPFCEDMTRLGTRLRVLVNILRDWWDEGDRNRRLVQEKFDRHIFSKEHLQEDLEHALEAFRQDLYANQQELLVSIKAAVSTGPMPELRVPDYSRFAERVNGAMLPFAEGRAKDSLWNGIVTMIASEIAGAAAGRVVALVLQQAAVTLGSRAALAAVASGGAATAGAASGAGGGSLAGPIGTAAGAIVGLGVGIVVDWWMTERFERKLNADMTEYLQRVRDAIVEGTDKQPGLRQTLKEVVDTFNEAQRQCLYTAIVGEKA